MNFNFRNYFFLMASAPPTTKTALIKLVNQKKQNGKTRETVTLERNIIKHLKKKKIDTRQKKETPRGKNTFYSVLNQSSKTSIPGP